MRNIPQNDWPVIVKSVKVIESERTENCSVAKGPEETTQYGPGFGLDLSLQRSLQGHLAQLQEHLRIRG